MNAEYEYINGKHVLRLKRDERFVGKRHTLDLELTPEQARALKVGNMV